MVIKSIVSIDIRETTSVYLAIWFSPSILKLSKSQIQLYTIQFKNDQDKQKAPFLQF
jgi:hypothetical protein